jgi:hypothetical protein
MFRMRVSSPSGELMIEGESLPGEGWRETLLRLCEASQGSSSQPLFERVGALAGSVEEHCAGKGVCNLVRNPEPGAGAGRPVETVRIETEPAQFLTLAWRSEKRPPHFEPHGGPESFPVAAGSVPQSFAVAGAWPLSCCIAR